MDKKKSSWINILLFFAKCILAALLTVLILYALFGSSAKEKHTFFFYFILLTSTGTILSVLNYIHNKILQSSKDGKNQSETKGKLRPKILMLSILSIVIASFVVSFWIYGFSLYASMYKGLDSLIFFAWSLFPAAVVILAWLWYAHNKRQEKTNE